MYDTDAMRTTLCYFVAVCLAFATLADVGVWWYSDKINLWGEDKKEDKKGSDHELNHTKS